MLNCKYCNRESKSKCGNTYHENRCLLNPNRIKGTSWNTNLELNDKKRAVFSYSGKENPDSIMELSKRTIAKVMKRLNLPCSKCGFHIDKVALDIHHIIEKKNGGSDDMNNLTYICPNCHRIAHTFHSKDFLSLKDYIGDTWKNYYYNKPL